MFDGMYLRPRNHSLGHMMLIKQHRMVFIVKVQTQYINRILKYLLIGFDAELGSQWMRSCLSGRVALMGSFRRCYPQPALNGV